MFSVGYSMKDGSSYPRGARLNLNLCMGAFYLNFYEKHDLFSESLNFYEPSFCYL